MDFLKKELAPISGKVWKDIEEGKRSFNNTAISEKICESDRTSWKRQGWG